MKRDGSTADAVQAAPAPTANRLYASLDAAVDGGLDGTASVVHLERGQVLADRGQQLTSVYFPIDAVLSMLTPLGDNTPVEFATVGREGLSAGPEIFWGAPTYARVISQISGWAAKVDAKLLRELVRNVSTADLLHRHTHALFVQVTQTAACNRVHSVKQRCARWLLMTHDRVARDNFVLTQEFLAFMLGVRRARVNVAAGELQHDGHIRYSRGRIRITDRAGLEGVACECYAQIRSEYERVIPKPPVAASLS